jgi:formylglycine-generating enzyme required for sulfatase activity
VAVLLLDVCLAASCRDDGGTGLAFPTPVCQITPSALVFDTVAVGLTKDLTFTIKNKGPGMLAGEVSEGCPDYLIQAGGGSYFLTANQELTVTMRFTPATAGLQTCAVSLGATACASVECSGTGTEPPPVTGSCCAVDSTCTVTMQPACSGTWTASCVCAPSPCMAPLGMVLVPAGTFTMGSPTSEPGRFSNETQHQVTLSRAIYVSTYEEMQSEWQAVMGWNESYFRGTGKPVENVTWYDAVSYCNQRSIRDGYTPVYTIMFASMDGNHIISATVDWNRAANGYRLLTEAEWEYACRATSTTAFCNGRITTTSSCSLLDPNLDQVGWYCGNASSTTHDCGGKTANAWGLRDMHGNVWEWCWDWYASYANGSVSDPIGPPSGYSRVFRGGFWRGSARYCRSAYRCLTLPGLRDYVLGLRLARTCP